MHMRKYYYSPDAEEIHLLPGSDMLQAVSTGDEWEEVGLGEI